MSVSLRRRLIGSVAAVFAVLTVVVLVPPRAEAVSPNIVISQVYGGGGNSGATYTHDFIELFNRGTTSASVNGWSVQYGSATGDVGAATNTRTDLPNTTLAPGQYVLIQEAQGAGGTTPLPSPDVTDATPIAMAAGAGKVALVNTTTSLGCGSATTSCTPAKFATIVDLVGYGNANLFEGSGAAPTLTNTTAALRINGGSTDTDDNAADFVAAAPTPRNSSDNDPVVASCGGALSTVAGYEARRTVTASDADGTVVDIAITDVTPSPAPGSITLGPVTPASAVGGTASAVVIADDDVPLGTYTVTVTASNDDATPQSGSCALSVNVVDILPIGEVQGSVGDGANGPTHRSPFAPASGNNAGSTTVAVKAVIYEKTLAKTSAGASQHGIFIQNTAATDDGVANSSDGIFVFMGGFTTLLRSSGPAYTPQVGDEIVLAGRVSEFFSFTQLSAGLTLVSVERSGVVLNTEVPAFEVDPPDDLADSNRYWERREGMRARVPANSLVVDSRDVFPGTADAEIWLIRSDHPVANRTDPFARRVFRDAHPLDNNPTPLFDDGNGYRFMLGSFGLKASTGDLNALLAPARTFDTVTNSPVGGVYFNFSKYQVMVEQQVVLSQGVDPSTNAPPQPFDRNQRFSIAPYNVENLYDFRDDPFDGCDFTGNSGCTGVNPPFDYVPSSDATYQAHLDDIAHQIAEDLHAPDIVMVQEAEDQDICAVVAGALVCGATNNADGKPDTLQELALRIEDVGGPAYDAAYDRDGADDRGIVAAFLYRTDRVELLPATAGDPVLGSSPTVEYRDDPLPYNTDVQNPKALNADLPDDLVITTGQDGQNVFTRAPQVGLFRIWQDGIDEGTSYDLYAISNHFSSTPDARVEQRTEQAAYDAAIVEALQDHDEDARVAVGGDFNVYPRPDDGVAPTHPLFPSDQLGPLYDQGLENLWDVLVDEVPSSAYSYIFQGQTQTLDQIFATPSLQEDLTTVRSAHVNADWPADFDGDGARGASDHDPMVAVYCRDTTAPDLSVTADPDSLWPPNHKYQTVQVSTSVSDDADPDPDVTFVSAVSNEPDNGPDDGNTTDDVVIVDDDTFRLRAERSTSGTGRVYTLTYQAVDSCGNSTLATATVTVPLEGPS